MGRGILSPADYGLGSIISRDPAKNGFGAFWAQKNTSDDNEFGVGIWPVSIKFVNVMLHYIQSGTKSGRSLELGTIQRPRKPRNLPGTGRQNLGLSG